MDNSLHFKDMRSALEAGNIEKRFPGWRSIEIFGAPGAGKSFFCRNLFERENIITTAGDIGMMRVIDQKVGPIMNCFNRVLGRRLMKNVYKFLSELISQNFWASKNPQLQEYIQTVEDAVCRAKLRKGSERNVLKSIRNTGLVIGLGYERRERILVDEGLVRKLVTLIVQSGTNENDQLESLRNCLQKYPWDKKAIFIDAPIATSSQRQVSRGHIIFGPGKTQADQQAAADKVWLLCKESGWETLRICNKNYLH